MFASYSTKLWKSVSDCLSRATVIRVVCLEIHSITLRERFDCLVVLRLEGTLPSAIVESDLIDVLNCLKYVEPVLPLWMFSPQCSLSSAPLVVARRITCHGPASRTGWHSGGVAPPGSPAQRSHSPHSTLLLLTIVPSRYPEQFFYQLVVEGCPTVRVDHLGVSEAPEMLEDTRR